MGICYDNIDRTGDTTGQPASQPASQALVLVSLNERRRASILFCADGKQERDFPSFSLFEIFGGDIWRYLEEEIDFWDNERELELCGKSFKIII